MFVVKKTGMSAMLVHFLILLSVCAVIIRLVEPSVETIGEGFWYLYVSATTIGFGDTCAVTVIGRLITVVVSLDGIVVAAMIPGVVVTYYTEYLKIRQNETVSTFLEKLEHLPELSKEELEELSEKIRKFNK